MALVALAVSLLAAACGGGGADIASAQNSIAEAKTPPVAGEAEAAGLIAPKALRALEGAAFGESVSGAQYEAAWPHQRAAVAGSVARFTPNADLPGIDGLAYAIYRLDLSAILPNGQLAFDWESAPGEGQLWLAVPDFKHDRWSWRSAADSAGLKLAGWNLYVTEFSELYVLVAVSGGDAAVLNRLGMGSASEVVEGGWRYERGDAQRSNRSEYTGPTACTQEWALPMIPLGPTLIDSKGALYFSQLVYGYKSRQSDGEYQFNVYNADGTLRYVRPEQNGVLGLGCDDTLYYWSSAYNESHERLSFLNAATPAGITKWSVQFANGCEFIALGPDDACYLAGHGMLYCLDPGGMQRWAVAQQVTTSTPAVFLSDGTLVVQESLDVLCGYNTQGRRTFTFTRPGADYYDLAVGPDDTLYWRDLNFWSGVEWFTAWKIGVGLRWQCELDRYVQDFAIGPDGTVYLISDGLLKAFGADGELRWSINPLVEHGGRKVYFDGLTVDASGKVFAFSEAIPSIFVFDSSGSFIVEMNISQTYGIYRVIIPAPGVLLVLSGAGLRYYREQPAVLYSPIELQASDGAALAEIRLDWEFPGGAVPDGYRVYRALTAEGAYALVGETGAATSFVDIPADPLQVYYYKVVAFRGAEQSAPSWEDAGFTAQGALPGAWSMAGGDPRHTRRSLAAGPASTTGAACGKFLKADTILTSPALRQDGTAYYGTGNGLLIAVTRFGEELWRYAAHGPIYSSPAIGADGTVFFGDATGACYALNPRGGLVWSAAAGASTLTSPVLGPDGALYYGSRDGSLYAVNPDGSPRWQFAAGGPIESAPALSAGGALYFGCNDGSLYAVTLAGGEAWRFSTGAAIAASPALGEDGAVHFGSANGKLYALNADGSLRWDYATGGPVIAAPALAADGGVCCGSTDGALYLLNADGTLRWRYATAGPILCAPALDANGTVYCGSGDGYLYAVQAQDALAWQLVCSAPVQGAPALGGDGTLYFAGTNGWVWSVPPS